ncbi:MAG: SsrA-binding protein SmpB [Oscillospiraceae bacterium]
MAATQTVAVNRKARHEYYVLDSVEAGIELVGTEVKSIRMGQVNLKDSWVDIRNGQAYLLGMHVSPYEKGNIFNRDPVRARRLLLHKREIQQLYAQVKTKGLALIPITLYFKNSNVKVQVGICKGKKLYDKRAVAAERDAKRSIDRAMSNKNA